MENIAQLLVNAAAQSPTAPFGTFQQNEGLDVVLDRARAVSDSLQANGLGRGDILAVIGTNCASYIVTWMAAQLAGIQTALINPGYPDEFLAIMLDDIAPQAVVWISRAPGAVAQRPGCQLDASEAWEGQIATLAAGKAHDGRGDGFSATRDEIAAYLHTSGTSGNPKFCALSHGYFLRLGRFFADAMAFTRHDIVHNPLPLFHINPTGNGLVSALTSRAGFLSTERFSAADFWPSVKHHGVTALILHAPPVSLLKAKTDPEEALGHKVRIGFACDPEFLTEYGIPLGIGGYGSTEAGGMSHTSTFRPGDTELPEEGALHLAGRARSDLDWKLAEDGEIMLREKAPHVLFSGYARHGAITPREDADGWFHTGDRGRLDQVGNLVFIERLSEAIRVNAEYVPIDFVEDRLRQVGSLGDFALWRLDSPTRGHEPVLYSASEEVDLAAIRSVVADLPRYMHPTKVIRIAGIPRDSGVGKIQRRLLSAQPVLSIDVLS